MQTTLEGVLHSAFDVVQAAPDTGPVESCGGGSPLAKHLFAYPYLTYPERGLRCIGFTAEVELYTRHDAVVADTELTILRERCDKG